MSSQTTEALVVTKHGGIEVLEVQSREVGQPGPGQLLVQVAAAGVNFIDVYQREGVYPVPAPFVLGSEGAGIVLAAGEGVRVAGEGDRVAWCQTLGSAAGLVLVPESDAVPVPEPVQLDQAAAVMLQGMTAHYLLNSTYAVQAGDTVLVHAAAGGVGQLPVQLAKAKGATVIGTVSRVVRCQSSFPSRPRPRRPRRARWGRSHRELHRGERCRRRGAGADRRGRGRGGL